MPMPEKQLDFWIWLWAMLTGPEMRAAWWAGIGGAMRAVAMHREGAIVRLVDVAATIFLAVGWGTALHSVVPAVRDGLERWFGWAFPSSVDFFPASMILVGLSGAAITMGLIDFVSELRAKFRSKP